jgi:spore maturation protein CgeB
MGEPLGLTFSERGFSTHVAPALGADLAHYDGVLAASSGLREWFLTEGLARHAWTWPEAADTRLFKPAPAQTPDGDVVWIGDWSEGELAGELEEFLLAPARKLRFKARVYGGGYTPLALSQLEAAGVEYGGWVPNYDLPAVFAQHKLTLHLPAHAQPRAAGVPTSRPFEALACGIPLVCAGGDDGDGLFQPGLDYGLARNGAEMTAWLSVLLNNPDQARRMAAHGRRTIERRHTCALRIDELLNIARRLPERSPLPVSQRYADLSVTA